jgi:hypothetical protein
MAPVKKKSQQCDDIVKFGRLLNGNGEKGVLEKVDEHEAFIHECRAVPGQVAAHEIMLQQMVGSLKMLKAIFGTSIVAVIISIIGLLLKVR